MFFVLFCYFPIVDEIFRWKVTLAASLSKINFSKLSCQAPWCLCKTHTHNLRLAHIMLNGHLLNYAFRYSAILVHNDCINEASFNILHQIKNMDEDFMRVLIWVKSLQNAGSSTLVHSVCVHLACWQMGHSYIFTCRGQMMQKDTQKFWSKVFVQNLAKINLKEWTKTLEMHHRFVLSPCLLKG